MCRVLGIYNFAYNIDLINHDSKKNKGAEVFRFKESRNKQESSKFMNFTLHSRTIPKKSRSESELQIDRVLSKKCFFILISYWSVRYFREYFPQKLFFFESVNCRKFKIVVTIIFVLCNENLNMYFLY